MTAKRNRMSNLASKIILVIGGAGFVGSNLCERLVKLGHTVISIDDYSTGSENNHVPGVQYLNYSSHEINRRYNSFIPDSIFHLGEYSRVEQSFDDINKVWLSNSTGTFEVLEFAKKHGAKLIYAGSSTKFGDIGSDSSPYAFTKSKNTELVKNYGSWYGLNYAITYFYNVYGKNEIPDGKYATLIAKFRKMKSLGIPLTVTLPGTQERNFTHVDDIVDGLILVEQHGTGDGYGIGADEAYSILEIAKLFDSPIEMTPEKRGNRHSAPVLSEKTKALGWLPKRKIIDYIST